MDNYDRYTKEALVQELEIRLGAVLPLSELQGMSKATLIYLVRLTLAIGDQGLPQVTLEAFTDESGKIVGVTQPKLALNHEELDYLFESQTPGLRVITLAEMVAERLHLPKVKALDLVEDYVGPVEALESSHKAA